MSSEKELVRKPEGVLSRRVQVPNVAIRTFLVILLLCLSTQITSSRWQNRIELRDDPSAYSSNCQQVDPFFPKNISKPIDDVFSYLNTEKFRNESIARLSGAVQIPSMSFD